MTRTAVGAPAPKPTVKEMLDAIDKMTWHEILEFKYKIELRIDKRRDKINEDRARNSDY